MKKRGNLKKLICVLVVLVMCLCGCSGPVSTEGSTENTENTRPIFGDYTVDEDSAIEDSDAELTEATTTESTENSTEEPTEPESTEAPTEEYVSETKPTEPETAVPPVAVEGTGILYDNGGYLVAIDPGHQGKGNKELEPIGPGSSDMKTKVTSGTAGVSTGIAEHVLNLAVSLYLRDELLARGYSVLMIRETADVNISNAERAELANSYGADAFVRVHANSHTDPAANGALTMCMMPDNPYNGDLYDTSRRLSELVLDGMCAETGARRQSIIETNYMSGINWCRIPVTIVEMGFMSNAAEDEAMAQDSYRRAMAKGIADGIDAYFGK